jgi:hypothetical protein
LTESNWIIKNLKIADVTVELRAGIDKFLIREPLRHIFDPENK